MVSLHAWFLIISQWLNYSNHKSIYIYSQACYPKSQPFDLLWEWRLGPWSAWFVFWFPIGPWEFNKITVLSYPKRLRKLLRFLRLLNLLFVPTLTSPDPLPSLQLGSSVGPKWVNVEWVWWAIPFCFFVFIRAPSPVLFLLLCDPLHSLLYSLILLIERRLRIHKMAFEKIKVANPVVEMDGEALLLFLLVSDPFHLPRSTSFSHVCWFPHP